jgi:AcrR family transcriptional regulator
MTTRGTRAGTDTSRRDAILREAAALFAAQGVTATTVRQVADHVGVLSGSLYHHFGSKEEIVQEIVVRYLDDVRRRYTAVHDHVMEPLERLCEIVVVSLEAAAEHIHAVEICQNEPSLLRSVPLAAYIATSEREIQGVWVDVIQDGITCGQFRPDVSVPLFQRLLRDAVARSARWYQPTKEYGAAELATDLLAVFFHGVSADRELVMQR